MYICPSVDTPDAPGKPEVEDVDGSSVTLAWSKPKNDGGDKVQGYVVEMKEKGTDKWKPVNPRAPCRDTTFTVDDLNKGQEYDFRVKAKNRAGLGKPSEGTGMIEVQPKASEYSDMYSEYCCVEPIYTWLPYMS